MTAVNVALGAAMEMKPPMNGDKHRFRTPETDVSG